MINKPLSSPFKGSYMLGSSDNYTTSVLFNFSENV